MSQITATMVKDLREKTGAGMMECKKALVEAKGDMQQAQDIIAKSGHKKAAKSASRTAAEGKIVTAQSEHCAVLIEVNSETDFVARDEHFNDFCQKVAQALLRHEVNTIDDLLVQPINGDTSIEEARLKLVAKLGENIQVRRIHKMNIKPNQVVGEYVHHSRIGALALVEGNNQQIAKEMAMHIASMHPQFIDSSEIPADVVAKEKEIFMAKAKDSGKPANIVEKMIEGQLKKYFSEICLDGQPFFKDQDKSVAEVLKSAQCKVIEMARFEVGEGIEVNKKSFEEEVMEQARSK